MTRKLFLGFSLMACLILLPQCGKVTQEIDRKAEKKREDFGLEVQLSVLLSEDEALPTASRMISEDKRLYASVFSVAEGAGLSSLSWGQIQLRNEDETDASGNVSQITVGTAMNRSDIVLKKADYQESYIKHSMPTGNVHDFEIQSRKLRLGFPMYILAVYSQADAYRLLSIDSDTADKNAIVLPADLSQTETFRVALYLMYLDQQLYSLESIQAFSDISGVFNDELVQAILDESGLPTQQSQSFDIKKPSLAYSGNLESQLLTIYELLTLDDKDLAKEKVEKLPLSKASKKLMTTAVDAYVLSTTDASGESSSTANAEAGDDESSEEE